MPDATAPTPAPAPAPAAAVDPFEAAGAILAGDAAEQPAAEAPAAAPPAAEQEQAAPPADEQSAEAKTDDEQEPEKPRTPKGVEAWRIAKLNRREHQLVRERQQLESMQAELRGMKEQLAPYLDAQARMARDPLDALQRLGIDSNRLFERMTREQLAKADPKEAAALEVQSLRERLEAFERQHAERSEREAREAQQSQMRRHMDADTQAVVAVLTNADQYPEIGVWERPVVEAIARHEVERVYRENRFGSTTVEDLAQAIHEHAKRDVGRFRSWWENRQTSARRDGLGTPGATAPKPAGSKPRSSLTNRDQSTGTTDARLLSPDERYARAGGILIGDSPTK
jgi:hypothetical protein